MRFQLRKCSECGRYTLKDECKKCNKKTTLVHPAKFSPDDKYARLRKYSRKIELDFQGAYVPVSCACSMM